MTSLWLMTLLLFGQVIENESGGCEGTPDLAPVQLLWFGGNGSSCSTRFTSTYTMNAAQGTDGEFPESFAMTHTDPGSGDEASLLDTQGLNSLCSMDVDSNGTTSNAGGYSNTDTTNTWTRPTGAGSFLMVIHHDTGDDDATTLSMPLLIGTSGDNRLQFRWNSDGDNMRVFMADGANATLELNTNADTSTCCDSGNCQDLFGDGDTNVGQWTALELRYDWSGGSGDDYTRLYIDGCLAISDTGTDRTPYDWTTGSAEKFSVGIETGSENGDWRVGLVAIANADVDLTSRLSGGDSTWEDGNECDCRDDTCGS